VAPFLSADAERRYPGAGRVEARFDIPCQGFSITVLFGPSGSGKTTILRMLAGLERPDAGRILCGDEVWADAGRGLHRPPQARRIGFLSQGYDLFPHLDVAANLAYGLPDLAPVERRARVADLLALLDLQGLEQRRPAQLSGGQRQRVALGRALAPRPALLLLDEPLSALDRAVQLRLRRDLRALLRRLEVPTVLVTHDRAEALQLGDRIVVMEDGRRCQAGPIQDVFERPSDPAVARILGVETVLLGRVLEVRDGLATLAVGETLLHAADPGGLGAQAYVCIRGEDVLLGRGEPGPGTARNRLPGRIQSLQPEGPLVRLTLACGFPLESLVTRQACADLGLAEGETVTALLKASALHLIPHD
jgi:molybdate transport system ATP-binding protein